MPEDILRQQFQAALTAPENDLLAALGAEVAKAELGIAPRSIKELVALANDWLLRNASSLARIFCGNALIKGALVQEGDDPTTLAFLVLDLAVQHYGKAQGLFVATVLVRRGMRELCQHHESSDEEAK